MPPGVPLTPELCTLLNPACQDASFDTLQSPIGHMVPKILWETPKKAQMIFLLPIFTIRGATYPKVMHTVQSGLSRCFFWHLTKSDQTYGSWDIKRKTKKSSNNFLMPIFITRGATYPKVMHTVESSLLRQFFWHLAKSNWTYSSKDIKCQENYGGAGVAGVGAQYVYLVLQYEWFPQRNLVDLIINELYMKYIPLYYICGQIF